MDRVANQLDSAYATLATLVMDSNPGSAWRLVVFDSYPIYLNVWSSLQKNDSRLSTIAIHNLG